MIQWIQCHPPPHRNGRHHHQWYRTLEMMVPIDHHHPHNKWLPIVQRETIIDRVRLKFVPMIWLPTLSDRTLPRIRLVAFG